MTKPDRRAAGNDIFGWSCIVTYRPYGTTNYVEKQIHRRGKSPSKVITSAKRMNGYRSYRDLRPYPLQEWISAFGNGTETGRYRIDV